MTTEILEAAESDDFTTVLLDDVLAAIHRMKDHPRERRSLVRTIFAAVEGNLAALCQELVAKASNGLTPGERIALSEKTIRVSENGVVQTVTAHLSLKSRVKLATGIVKKLHPEYSIDFGGSGWQALLLGLDVRDRLMHPKQRTDLDVNISEAVRALDGGLWFLRQVIGPSHAGLAAYIDKQKTSLLLTQLMGYGGKGIDSGLLADWPSQWKAPES